MSVVDGYPHEEKDLRDMNLETLIFFKAPTIAPPEIYIPTAIAATKIIDKTAILGKEIFLFRILRTVRTHRQRMMKTANSSLIRKYPTSRNIKLIIVARE